MPEQNKSRLSAEEAYEQLISELYDNGPMELVGDEQHADLINGRVRLCCVTEPFLAVIRVMQKHELVQAVKKESQRLFVLTSKGYLTALVMRYRTRRDTRCRCNKCALEVAEAFEKLLLELLQNGPMELTASNHRDHPHFMSDNKQLCCRQAPFLDAVSDLEKFGLVEMTHDFVYKLTERGALSARLLQVPAKKMGNPLFN